MDNTLNICRDFLSSVSFHVELHKMAHSVGDLDIFELFDRVPGRQNTRAGADPLNVRPLCR
jgi:hypothetical protein